MKVMKSHIWQILLLIPVVLLTNCVGFTPFVNEVEYEVELSRVTKPTETEERWGSMTDIEVTEENRYHYEDQLISAYFVPAKDRIMFEMQNKTDHSIKIIWNEANFINTNGQGSRIMHSGVRYIDRNNIMPPSVIPAHTKISDQVLPVSQVYTFDNEWKHGSLVSPGYEVIKPQYVDEKEKAELSDDLQKQVEANIGREVGLLLPLEIQGTTNEYTFWFKVTEYDTETGIPFYTWIYED